ncbi:MAG: choloylglycine hydrolase family protein [Desulfarculaceae bacterium]|nr:choloylglycine hydrolase family protein [Desulfarculaceae bacterium]MCF8073867.1 choloylglycine hydrolase family protein [Desulfarculaceae bacterium]MCF8102847.1 choloylglycine hydrolase family protein [Desulfarculaceae bacterium]MCF8116291.1 choloylglycine hydrolase family protein [Desulfarculaceae bacterium]
MKALKFALLLAACAALLAAPAAACTGITVKAKNGAVVHARTLEFGVNLQSQVLMVPRGYALATTAPGNKPGMKWKAKYAVMGMDAFGLTAICDGMNEKGLAVGLFYFPGFAGYQKVGAADQGKCLAPLEAPLWILTNFTTVAEVKAALPKVKVWGAPLPQLGPDPLPVHFIVTDRSGKSLVVEYVGGKLHMYDNPLGVITNSPPFDWHMTNLRNYVNLSANNVPKLKLTGITLYPTGQGSGMAGLPGDVTPPSRLVRAVAFSQAALPASNGDGAVMSALRLLNSFYISKGMARSYKDGKVSYDITEWMAASDLKNLKFYFATYENLTPKMVDMKKLDLGGTKLQRISIHGGPRFTDVTGQAK